MGVIDFCEKRKLREEHLEHGNAPPGPPCPLCRSKSYVLARGTERTQYKCVRYGHGFIYNNVTAEEDSDDESC
jgi:hypothetical protein